MATGHRKTYLWLTIAAVGLAGAAAVAVSGFWLPSVQQFLGQAVSAAEHDECEEADHDHAAHADKKPSAQRPARAETTAKPERRDHDEDAHGKHNGHEDEGDEDHKPGETAHEHPGESYDDHVHNDAAAITLSRQAKGNLGLRTTRVELRTFDRTITVPGIVVERPGRSTLQVTAPLTGVVTKVYPLQGEAVSPSQPLFDMRLTHEELVQAQGDFLRTAEELEVVRREVARLEKVAAEGAIAGKTLLERKYEQQKQEAVLRAQRQALLLHGLSAAQVDAILSTHTLLGRLTVSVPTGEDPCQPSSSPPVLQVQELRVTTGQHVNAGDTLCLLADHRELYLEGRAFEQDVEALTRAASKNWTVSTTLDSKSDKGKSLENLKILYLADKVEPESRALRFYVTLPNRLVREDRQACGSRFVYWQFRPGQRTEIKVPVERWTDRIVLPVEAVAQDGAEAYVFEANGDHFDRRPVRVEYRDQRSVVIANDGSLKLGGLVAESAAHEMQLALKNKAGGGVDPHAGHNH